MRFYNNEGLFFLLLFLNMFLLMFQINRILMALLAFEFLVLNIFFVYVYMSCPYEGCPNLVFLAIAAGEARIGLSVLVTLVRNGGREKLRRLSLIECEGSLGY